MEIIRVDQIAKELTLLLIIAVVVFNIASHYIAKQNGDN
jgi:uncharacterized protein (UPF0333 family)